MPQPSVIIIGAGVAGLAAATTLAAAGWPVTLLDKARRAGGRCASRRTSQAADSPWFDFGAQYFTARQPDFIRHTKQALAAGLLQPWRPEIGRWENGQMTPSTDEQMRLVGRNGLSSWIKHQASQLALLPNLNFHHQQQVTTLKHSPNSQTWSAHTQQGQTFNATHLIVTAPPEQTSALCEEAAPALSSAIAPFRSDACWSVVMHTRATLPYQALFFKDHPSLSWAANNPSKYPSQTANLGLWTLHANPAWSAQQLNASAERVSQQLINDFMACFPSTDFLQSNPPHNQTRNQRIQKHPNAVHTHRWLYARPADNAGTTANGDRPFVYHPQQKIGLAGDWLAGGRVEGAWVSGNALAKQLLT